MSKRTFYIYVCTCGMIHVFKTTLYHLNDTFFYTTFIVLDIKSLNPDQ